VVLGAFVALAAAYRNRRLADNERRLRARS